MKKVLSITLAFVLMLGILGTSVLALEATPTASTVLVNGENVAFEAYLIEGNNYFKLRDLAYTLNGTVKQFSVGFDGVIYLTSGQPYATVGGEMTGKGVGIQTPETTNSKIIKNGAEVEFEAYLINGNNYFKLRDIGAAFDFGVDWDGERNTIVIDTSKGYVQDGAMSNNNLSVSEIKMKKAEEDDFTFNVPTDWVRKVMSDYIYYYVDDTDFLMLGVSELSESINKEIFESILEGVQSGFEKFTVIEKGAKDSGNGRKFYHIKFSGVISSQDVMSELYVISWNGKLYQFMMANLGDDYKYTEQMNKIISSVEFKTAYVAPAGKSEDVKTETTVMPTEKKPVDKPAEREMSLRNSKDVENYIRGKYKGFSFTSTKTDGRDTITSNDKIAIESVYVDWSSPNNIERISITCDFYLRSYLSPYALYPEKTAPCYDAAKKYMKTIADDLMTKLPGVEISECYFHYSWYTYPNIKQDLNWVRYCGWRAIDGYFEWYPTSDDADVEGNI